MLLSESACVPLSRQSLTISEGHHARKTAVIVPWHSNTWGSALGKYQVAFLPLHSHTQKMVYQGKMVGQDSSNFLQRHGH
jgi:hypothetical protein